MPPSKKPTRRRADLPHDRFTFNIPHIAWTTSLFYLTGVILLVFTVAPFVTFNRKVEAVSYLAGVYALSAFGLGTLLFLARRKIDRLFKTSVLQERFHFVILIGSAILFAVQILLLQTISFRTGWDVSWLMGALIDEKSCEGYFSLYPNQLFLLAIFKAISHVGLYAGFPDAYPLLTIVGAFCVTASITLSAFTARTLAGASAGYASFFLGAAFLGLSPWISVPYSDAYGILCPSIVLFFFTCSKNRLQKIFCITFFSLVGYFIKPTSIFVLLAIALVSLPKLMEKLKSHLSHGIPHSDMKTMAVTATALVIAIFLALSLNAIAKLTGPNIDETRNFSASHFLMMGFGLASGGAYSEDDVQFSASFPDKQSRQQGNIEEWARRVSDLGPAGIAELFLKKTLSNFGDGTFAWEQEGTFYKEVSDPGSLPSKYFGIGGENNFLFRSVSQTLWFFILVGIALCWLIKKPSHTECVIAITLFMLAIFLTLFEARARYLFLYAPYFILLGILGWQAAFRRVENAFTHSKDSPRLEPFPGAARGRGRAWHGRGGRGRPRCGCRRSSRSPTRDAAGRRGSTCGRDGSRGRRAGRTPGT